MRKIVFAAAMAGAALALAACSDRSDDAADPAAEATTDAGTGAAGDMEAPRAAGVLDANSATAAQLASVEGMSPELAEAIVAGQPYAGVTALNAKLRETLSAEETAAILTGVFVPVNLNSASREDIALIPGMTDRMIGEFLEYRPYEDMAEFDREIGKYVDEAEVARFRRYVTL